MRGILACVVGSTILSIAAIAADTGVPPRGASTDYPAHGTADTAIIAAAVIPPNQVAKMFSSEIGKQYIVAEVAIYPANGVPFDVESVDFALRVGQRVGRADRPIDVAPWAERRDSARLPVDVTTETGVVYQRSDPVYGHQQSVGTYTGVGVSAPGQNVPPPPSPKADEHAIYEKVRRSALAEGATKTMTAGYLYFPQYAKRRKSDAVEVKYAKDNVKLNLALGKP
jgi:hypothetical protein